MIAQNERDKIVFLTAGVAVLSLLVNGTTTGPLVRFLKLDRCALYSDVLHLYRYLCRMRKALPPDGMGVSTVATVAMRLLVYGGRSRLCGLFGGLANLAGGVLVMNGTIVAFLRSIFPAGTYSPVSEERVSFCCKQGFGSVR